MCRTLLLLFFFIVNGWINETRRDIYDSFDFFSFYFSYYWYIDDDDDLNEMRKLIYWENKILIFFFFLFFSCKQFYRNRQKIQINEIRKTKEKTNRSLSCQICQKKEKEKIMLDRFDHKNDNNNDVSGQIIQYDTRLSWTNFVII